MVALDRGGAQSGSTPGAWSTSWSTLWTWACRRAVSGSLRAPRTSSQSWSATSTHCDARQSPPQFAAPRGTHVRNGCYSKSCRQYALSKRKGRKRSGWGEHLRSIHEPSFTVLANRGLNWITRTATGIKKKRPRLSTHEYAALQSFPQDYKWPEGANLGMKQVGNSVPPLVASLLMRAATIYV